MTDVKLELDINKTTQALYKELQTYSKTTLAGMGETYNPSSEFLTIIKDNYEMARGKLPQTYVPVDMASGKPITLEEVEKRLEELRKIPSKVVDFLYIAGQDFNHEIAKDLNLTQSEIEKAVTIKYNDLIKMQSGAKTPIQEPLAKINTSTNNLIQINGVPPSTNLDDWFEKIVLQEAVNQGIKIPYTRKKRIGILVIDGDKEYLYIKNIGGPSMSFTSDLSTDPTQWKYNEDSVDYDKTTGLGYANFNPAQEVTTAFQVGHFRFADSIKRQQYAINAFKMVKERINSELKKAKNDPLKEELRLMLQTLEAKEKDLIEFLNITKEVTSIPFTLGAAARSSTTQRSSALLAAATKAAEENKEGLPNLYFIAETDGKLVGQTLVISENLRSLLDKKQFSFFFSDLARINQGARSSLEKQLGKASQARVVRAGSATPLTTVAMLSLIETLDPIGVEDLKKALYNKVKQNVPKRKKETLLLQLPVNKKRIPKINNLKLYRTTRPRKKVTIQRSSRKNKQATEFNTEFNVLELNNYIAEAVKSVMKKPALVNDTGVFANSVRITGFDEKLKIIKAFYKPDPYDLFSTSSTASRAKTSIEQDPIRIINKAVQSMRNRWEPYLGSKVRVERG